MVQVGLQWSISSSADRRQLLLTRVYPATAAPLTDSLTGVQTVAGLGETRASAPLAGRPERRWQVRTVAVGAAPFGEIPSNQEILRRISALMPEAGQNEPDQHVVSQVILKQFTEPWGKKGNSSWPG